MSFSRNRPARGEGFNLSLRALAAVLSALVLAGIFYAYSLVQARNVSYQLSQALEVQRELMETSRRLKVELNNLRSLERLEAQALSLGLSKPSTGQLRNLP